MDTWLHCVYRLSVKDDTVEGERWRPEDSLKSGLSTESPKTKLALAHSSSLLDQTTRSKLKLGLFSYPVLQAADILLYG